MQCFALFSDCLPLIRATVDGLGTRLDNALYILLKKL